MLAQLGCRADPLAALVLGGCEGMRTSAITAPATAIAAATNTEVWNPWKKAADAASCRLVARPGFPLAPSCAAAPRAVPTERWAPVATSAGNPAGISDASRLAYSDA